MNDQLKETLDKVKASEELKEKTRVFLAKKTQGYTKTKNVKYHHFISISAAACLLVLLVSGGWLYLTPTAKISIDINPSIELGVNRFDKVVSVNSYNEDGAKLAESIRIKFMDYGNAIDQILESDRITKLLSNDEIVTITVIGHDGGQTDKMLSDIESGTKKHRNTYCYSANQEEVSEAHDVGLSCGKYKAFLELKALDPDVTPEEIQNMTMREIHDLIHALSSESENGTQKEDKGEHGHRGERRGNNRLQEHGGNGHGSDSKN